MYTHFCMEKAVFRYKWTHACTQKRIPFSFVWITFMYTLGFFFYLAISTSICLRWMWWNFLCPKNKIKSSTYDALNLFRLKLCEGCELLCMWQILNCSIGLCVVASWFIFFFTVRHTVVQMCDNNIKTWNDDGQNKKKSNKHALSWECLMDSNKAWNHCT